MGTFEFFKEKCASWSDLAMRAAHHAFVHRDFAAMAEALEESVPLSSKEKDAVALGLALSLHVLGREKEAQSWYQRCIRTMAWAIDFHAFCHRFYRYSEIAEKDAQGWEASPLAELLDHNSWNRDIHTHGYEPQHLEHHEIRNFYDEQVRNVCLRKQGKMPGLSQERQMEARLKLFLAERLQPCSTRLPRAVRPRVGIFVTDVQRHQDSALALSVARELAQQADVIVYFNNLFENKFVRELRRYAVVRSVARENIVQVAREIAADDVQAVLDFAGDGLRNDALALSLCSGVLSMDDLLAAHPFLPDDAFYFGLIPERHPRRGISVIGDFRFTPEEELTAVRAAAGGRPVRFIAASLDEPLFRASFQKRLSACGFTDEDIHFCGSLRPFTRYEEQLASSEEVFVLTGASFFEFAEALQLCPAVHALARGKAIQALACRLRSDSTRFDDTLSMPSVDVRMCWRAEFFDALRARIHVSRPARTMLSEDDDDVFLRYVSDGFCYDVNVSCSGDFVVWPGDGV